LAIIRNEYLKADFEKLITTDVLGVLNKLKIDSPNCGV
jgi:hypothetical protein